MSYPPKVNKLVVIAYSNVWAQCPVGSTFGFRYFVTFIDDHSRVTWNHLIKAPSKIFTVFRDFCSEIKIQFGVSIRALRSAKYCSAPFNEFMSQNRINHRSLCAHTPHQNGVAEQKNQHLLEVARTLLLKMPKNFWGDAILTICYLINHMSPTV